MLLSVVIAVVVVGAVSALAAALTALPFVVTVDMAERRRFSATRWGGVQLALLALAAVIGLLAIRHTLLLVLPVPLLCWAPALTLALLSAAETEVGGYQGAHEA
ncbi:MAG: hypothetical protein JWO22_2721 [Frankiales bacterium]|nr:hypothetical protein [Frankiales bacterium]